MNRNGVVLLWIAGAFGLLVNLWYQPAPLHAVLNLLQKDGVRDWFAAMSGWVAALAATVALVPIYGQLRELRRQTAFTVGDELPSVEIWTNNDHAVYRCRVVNWNRRAFIIYEVRWLRGPRYQVEPVLRVSTELGEGGDRPDKVCTIGEDGRLAAWTVVEGWEDRGKPPEVKRFWRYATEDPMSAELRIFDDEPAEVELIGVLAGEERRKIKIRAKAPTLVDLTPKRGGPGPYPHKSETSRYSG